MGQIKFIGSILMAGLFAMLIINYTINYAQDNNVAIDISNDVNIVNANSNLITNLKNTQSQANASSISFAKASIKSGDQTTEGGGFFKTLTASFSAIKNVLTLGKNTLGGSNQGDSPIGLSLTVFGGFLSIVSLLYVWKTWAGKNPD